MLAPISCSAMECWAVFYISQVCTEDSRKGILGFKEPTEHGCLGQVQFQAPVKDHQVSPSLKAPATPMGAEQPVVAATESKKEKLGEVASVL